MDYIDQAIAKFNEGALSETIEACNEGLRNKPKDLDLRVFLCQALAFTGNWDRIDKIAEQIMGQSKDSKSTFFFGSVAKNLVVGERLREKVWNEGQLPELMTEKDELLESHLRAWTENLANNSEQAQKTIDEYNAATTTEAECNGADAASFQDIDPITSRVFEFLLPTGGYIWLPMNQISRIDFSEVTRPMDQCWRQANIVLKDERSLYAYMPCLYFGSWENSDEVFQLGRSMDWMEGNGKLPRAAGRRFFAMGDREMCAMEISSITFKG